MQLLYIRDHFLITKLNGPVWDCVKISVSFCCDFYLKCQPKRPIVLKACLLAGRLSGSNLIMRTLISSCGLVSWWDHNFMILLGSAGNKKQWKTVEKSGHDTMTLATTCHSQVLLRLFPLKMRLIKLKYFTYRLFLCV